MQYEAPEGNHFSWIVLLQTAISRRFEMRANPGHHGRLLIHRPAFCTGQVHHKDIVPVCMGGKTTAAGRREVNIGLRLGQPLVSKQVTQAAKRRPVAVQRLQNYRRPGMIFVPHPHRFGLS